MLKTLATFRGGVLQCHALASTCNLCIDTSLKWTGHPSGTTTNDVIASSGPLELYLRKIENGELQHDEIQQHIVIQFQQLYDNLRGYEPPKPTFLHRLFGKNVVANAPKGLYLYGAVGGGKTMLMDLFYSCFDQRKKRVHFHEFMLDVHKRIHQFKLTITKESGSTKPKFSDPIPPVAKSIREEAWILCLDEFQVTDIGDAMVLKRLFTNLFDSGVITVATSNRKPDDLYKNGLQRSNFVPFIQILKDHCSVLSLDSGIDYRLRGSNIKHLYFIKGECDADRELDRIFKILLAKENDIVRPRVLTVNNRNLYFARTCGQVLDSTFDELCDKPRGASDYLLLCQVFHTIIIRNIPQMNSRMKNQARRLITLIDTLYDQKVRVVCSADVPFSHLFVPKLDATEVDDEHRVLMDDLSIDKGSENSHASIFTGEEEIFAFNRTVSRLSEMQTAEYWSHRDNSS